MLEAIAKRMFGSANERYLRKLQPTVDAINALEPEVESLSDNDLKARTPWLKKRLCNGEDIDDLLVDAFATVREASKRTLGERHFDVQLMGGMILHRGMISEMKTGEGKTLVATAEMVQKIRAATDAKRDPNFLLMARTDANAVEGLDAMIERAKAYVDAGADMIMTQPIFDPRQAKQLYAATKHLDFPIFLGVMPLVSAGNTEFLHNEVPGFVVTDDARARMARFGRGKKARREGIAIVTALIPRS